MHARVPISIYISASSGNVCNLFPEVSYLKIGMMGHMVSPHGKILKIGFLDFLSLGGSCVWKGL